MYTFFVATDFSKAAENATRYAAQLAQKINANLILFHIATHKEASGPGRVSATHLQICLEKLENQALAIADEYKLHCKPVIGLSHSTESIMAEAEKEVADIIIMGITAAPRLEKGILGSKTQDLICKGTIPVLAIPENMKFHAITKIVLAVGTHTPDYGMLQKLVRFASVFHAHIELIHIHHGKEKIDSPYLETSDLIKKTGYQKISCTVIKGEDTAKELDRHLHLKNASLLVIIRKHLGLFQDVFSGLAGRMTYVSDVPLLVFNEEEFNIGQLGVKEEEILG
jgi:nucleotide-binding universal stress UspA family protein